MSTTNLSTSTFQKASPHLTVLPTVLNDPHTAKASSAVVAATDWLLKANDQERPNASSNPATDTEFDTSSITEIDDGTETDELMKKGPIPFRRSEKVTEGRKRAASSGPASHIDDTLRHRTGHQLRKRLRYSEGRNSRVHKRRCRSSSTDSDERPPPALEIVYEGRTITVCSAGVEVTFDLFGMAGGVRIVDNHSGSTRTIDL